MVEEGFISKEAGEAVKQEPLNVLPLRRATAETGSYFFEEVRKYIERIMVMKLFTAGASRFIPLSTQICRNTPRRPWKKA